MLKISFFSDSYGKIQIPDDSPPSQEEEDYIPLNLDEQPDENLDTTPEPTQSTTAEESFKNKLLDEIMNFGFTREQVLESLKLYPNDMQAVVDHLCNTYVQ
jgi:hypothetical protein